MPSAAEINGRLMLATLKFSALALLVVLVGIVSLWLSNTGKPWWSVPLFAMLSAIGLLSSLLLGDKDAAFRRAAEAAWEFLFRSPLHAGAMVVILAVAVVACAWQAWRTWPAGSDYFSVLVFRQLRQPAYFAIGARVLLHTHTDGATHMKLVGKDGFARFDALPPMTTAVLQINVRRDHAEWAWGAPPLTIKGLPDQTEYDLAKVPAEEWVKVGKVPELTQPGPGGAPAPPQTAIGDSSLQSLNAPWGVPGAPTVIYRYAYVLGFDTERRIPLWVAYATTASQRDVGPRPRFVADPALPESMQSNAADFRAPEYDRGHLVSPSDVRYKGRVAVEEANYQTTLTPQTPALNRGAWFRLERATRALSERLGRAIYILSGPLFGDGTNTETIGRNHIPVPSQFFRVIVWQTDRGEVDVAAYLLPNKIDRRADFQQYAVAVRDLETATKLTFLPALGPETAAVLKAEPRRLPNP